MRGTTSSRGAISPGRRAWLRLDKLAVILYRNPGRFLSRLPDGARQVAEYEPLVDEHGDDISLMFEPHSGRPVRIYLTDFTEPELQAFQRFIDDACERATPIVQARDRIVQELFDEYGDDTHTRLYRGLPELHVRKGEGREYDESVQQRPQGASVLEQLGIRVTPIAPIGDRKVAERNARERGPEDDGTTADERAGVGEVGGEPRSPF